MYYSLHHLSVGIYANAFRSSQSLIVKPESEPETRSAKLSSLNIIHFSLSAPRISSRFRVILKHSSTLPLSIFFIFFSSQIDAYDGGMVDWSMAEIGVSGEDVDTKVNSHGYPCQ